MKTQNIDLTRDDLVRKDFITGADGDADYQEWLQLKAGRQASTQQNPAPTAKRKLRLLEVSEEITVSRPDPANAGAMVERKFFNLSLADSKGEPSTLAVNSEFFKRIAPRLNAGRPYEFKVEVRKEGSTTYVVKEKGKDVVRTHATSGESLVSFQAITERAFDEGVDADIDRIQMSGDASNAVADYLKGIRSARIMAK